MQVRVLSRVPDMTDELKDNLNEVRNYLNNVAFHLGDKNQSISEALWNLQQAFDIVTECLTCQSCGREFERGRK